MLVVAAAIIHARRMTPLGVTQKYIKQTCIPWDV